MPALEIPGYYYDEEKKKYFKVEPNHINPKYEKYSKGHVSSEKRENMKRKRENAEARTLQRERIQRPRAMYSTIGGHTSHLSYGSKNSCANTLSYRSSFAVGLEVFTEVPVHANRSKIHDFVMMSSYRSVMKANDRNLTIRNTSEMSWLGEEEERRSQDHGGLPDWSTYHGIGERAVAREEPYCHRIPNVTHLDFHDESGLMTSVSHNDNGKGAVIDIYQCALIAGGFTNANRIERHVKDNTTIWRALLNPSTGTPGRIALATSDGPKLMIASNTKFSTEALSCRNRSGLSSTTELRWCDPNIVAFASRKGVISLLDVRTSEFVGIKIYHPSSIAAMDIGDDPLRLLVAGIDGPLHLYDMRNRTARRYSNANTAKHRETIPVLQFSGYENRSWNRIGLVTSKELDLAAASDGHGRVLLWSMKTGKKLRTFDTFARRAAPILRWHTNVDGGTELWASVDDKLTKFAWHA